MSYFIVSIKTTDCHELFHCKYLKQLLVMSYFIVIIKTTACHELFHCKY